MTILFDPDPIAFYLPWTQIAIHWYGICFALGFFFAYRVGAKLLQFTPALMEKLLLWVVIGTIGGARMGHLLFYERPALYLWEDPWMVLRLRDGGLASHGALVGIVTALFLFQRFVLGKKVLLLHLCNCLALPVSIAAVFIRIGNFLNQEIVGTLTSLPWGIHFVHPIGFMAVGPRHPVQLYEAFCYAFLALVLWKADLSKRAALFFTLCFTGRFLCEFFKEEQSLFWSGTLTMGQLLSLPLILMGMLFLAAPTRRASV